MSDKKRVLDVTTKGWSKEDIEKMRQSLIAQGIQWKAEILLANGKTKWAYCRDPDAKDIGYLCEQLGAKIIKVEKF